MQTDSWDDYVCFGGIMKKVASARRYLDTAVAQNISRSLEKLSHFANKTALMNVSEKEMCCVIENAVERYSGVINRDAVNADTDIKHKFDDDMMLSLENQLISLGFLSATNKQVLLIEEFGYRTEPLAKEYYIVQPAVRYHYMVKALYLADEKESCQQLSENGKQDFKDTIATQIKEDMTKQIIVYETSKALSSQRYFVSKLCFRNDAVPNKDLGGLDMLVYDKQQNCCWGFEIAYSVQASSLQYKDLVDQRLVNAVKYMYGNIQRLCVLYNGEPFVNSKGIVYLNIPDFLKEIKDNKDVESVLLNLNNKLHQKIIDDISAQNS